MNDAQPAAQRLYIRRQENTKCIMYRYAAFLRAVNVGRGRTVKMDELRKMAEDLGFVDVRTFIQSGNLIFASASEDKVALAQSLAGKIGERFGFVPEIILRTKDEMERIMSCIPLLPDGRSDASDLYVVVLSGEPSEAAKARLAEYCEPGESFALVGDVIYVRYGNGVGRSKFSNAYIEKRLGLCATTRNRDTMTRILDMMKE